jgi:hypothetical protein
VYCPVQRATLAAIAGGDLDALDRDPHAGPILAIIERSADLGNFGRYRGVFELGIGVEGFTPQPGALPALGRNGVRTLSCTAAIATFVPMAVSPARLAELLDALAAAHPWEIPVIEVADVHLFGEPPAD